MIRILLAEDMHMVRGALVALLDLEDDFEVVAELARGDEILPAAIDARPDVAVLDIDLPGLDGLSAAALLHERVPGCRTLVLTALGRPGTLRRAMTAHVSGFLLKDESPQRLADAIRRVHAGGRVVDAELAMAAWEGVTSPLTERESEVLRFASHGYEAAEIAKELNLTVGTVRNYLTAVVTKLNARNRVDAVRIAREQEWIV
ncbi:response regulator transcription factor [Yinghuangia seranimata]|uniref:response regulator transcription factor n=1 Tax=Yinghuangia seranimata TaxID=408067 RepID=UPI00248A9F89|nr:response regulator transcription factor [Yinghuangia seranimata]MDI2128408.1 response regulator transcription factor [Yinghuangia seranimata]